MRPKKVSINLVATKRHLIDTHVLVRFFTGEPPEMAAKARRLVERADSGELLLIVPPVIVAETIYTLESFYEMERKQVAAKLLAFLQSRGIEAAEFPRLADALNRCHDRNAHFADAYLAAAAAELKSPIASFDRDFDKFKDVQRAEPK
jgi:predicted nucleic acid-binding protein